DSLMITARGGQGDSVSLQQGDESPPDGGAVGLDAGQVQGGDGLVVQRKADRSFFFLGGRLANPVEGVVTQLIGAFVLFAADVLEGDAAVESAGEPPRLLVQAAQLLVLDL